MPKKTFYLSEDDLSTYEKAKSIAGDSISSVIMQGLKDFVVKWEKQDKDFIEIVIFEGKRNPEEKTLEGQNIMFVGKKLSSKNVEYDQGVGMAYSLYLTRKGKLLLYMVNYDYTGFPSEHCSYEVKDRIQDFKDYTLPHDLLSEAEKNMPGITCKVLDI
jgi:hypothetical protein